MTGTAFAILAMFCIVSEAVSKKIGTGKVPELVSKKFSTKKSRNRSGRKFGIEKSLGTGLGENLVPKKVLEPSRSDFWYCHTLTSTQAI